MFLSGGSSGSVTVGSSLVLNYATVAASNANTYIPDGATVVVITSGTASSAFPLVYGTSGAGTVTNGQILMARDVNRPPAHV